MQGNDVAWCQPCIYPEKYVNCGRTDTMRLLSLDMYMQKYGVGAEGHPDLQQRREELLDWICVVPFRAGDVEILCCPEDRVCARSGCVLGRKLCGECWVPMCSTCHPCLDADKPKVPHAALANDMIIFYAPREVYAQEATVMEMICASVCITSMVCFSLEARYGNMLNTTAHMQRHRVGARGNATSFPMPWQSILAELMRLDTAAGQHESPALPRTGTN